MQSIVLMAGKHVISQPRQPAVDLQFLCEKLRGTHDASPKSKSTRAQERSKSQHKVPDCAYDLLQGLLHLDPVKRLSADQALKHKYFDR